MLFSLTYALPVGCVWGYSNVPIINAKKKISTLILNEQKRPPYPFLGRSRDAELGAVEPAGVISGVSGLAGAEDAARPDLSFLPRAGLWMRNICIRGILAVGHMVEPARRSA